MTRPLGPTQAITNEELKNFFHHLFSRDNVVEVIGNRYPNSIAVYFKDVSAASTIAYILKGLGVEEGDGKLITVYEFDHQGKPMRPMVLLSLESLKAIHVSPKFQEFQARSRGAAAHAPAHYQPPVAP